MCAAFLKKPLPEKQNHSQTVAHTMSGVNDLKDEEKKPITWEVADPKPPVVRSGHMENRRQNNAE